MGQMEMPETLSREVLFCIDGFSAQLCCSPESKKIAQNLRYKAYLNAGLIEPNELELLKDAYDDQANTRIHLIWYENQAVATVRSCIWSAKYDWILTEGIQSFQKAIEQHIGLENNILESNRYAVSPEFSGRKSLRAQLLLFRIQDLNAQVEECQHIITLVREKHIPFYERMLGFEAISSPIHYEWAKSDVVCMRTTAEQGRNRIVKKGMPPCTLEDLERYKSLVGNF